MFRFNQFTTNLVEDASTINQVPHLGSDTERGTTVHGIHYSHHPDLHALHGHMSGTGIKGAEQDRLAQSSDHRIKSRVYFYNKQPGRLPAAESGLGPHVHSAILHGIYDPDRATHEDRESVRQHKQKYLVDKHANPSNAFESALVDAGFRGYTNRGMTVVLNHATTPVKYEGHKFDVRG